PHARPSQQVLGWTPGILEGSPLRSVPFAWLRHGNHLELAGVDAAGMLRWQRLRMGDGPVTLSLSVCGRQTGYLAATVIRPGVIAGMKSGRIDWLRAVGSQFSL